MRIAKLTGTAWLLSSAAVGALTVTATSAFAGGFEVREQSSFFQGTSFAGSAAGGSSLSSIFWNPAASSFVGSGVTTDSSYTLVLPNAELTADRVTGLNAQLQPIVVNTGDNTADIGRDAIVPASYAAWRFDDRTVFALSMNSPFGLTTKPDNVDWDGAGIARTSKVFSLNVTPTVSYQLAPWLSVGGGAQFQYLEIKALDTSAYNIEAEDIAIGGVAGINITPFRGTSIGLGYRSRIRYDLEGSVRSEQGAPKLPFLNGDLSASLDTPDKVTLSFRQEVTPSARLLGTVEWTNWSLLGTIPVNLPADPKLFGLQSGVLSFNWDDGWFYSLGGEYDISPKLSVRAGVAYEESPIQSATSRLVQLPDNNRTWASIGASYDWSATTKVNLAYSHVFVEDGDIKRESLVGPGAGTFAGSAEASVDIVSVGLTMKLGGPEAEPLK